MKCCVLACLLVFALPGTLSAQADVAEIAALNWVRLPGAESCITAAELAQRVETRLERRVFVLVQHAEVDFHGFVQPRAAGGFTAHLAVSNLRGEVLGARDLESAEADCRSLDDALVLITALTLFPGSFGLPSGGIALDAETTARLHALFADEPSELDPAELPAHGDTKTEPLPRAARAEIPTKAQPESLTRGSQNEPAHERTRLALEASPVAGFGVLPGVALGASGEVTLRLRGLWPLRMGFTHFFSRDARATTLVSGVGHFERNDIALFACPAAPDRDFAFELCTCVALGLVRVTTDGFAHGGIRGSDPVFDVGAQAGARLRLFDLVLARAALTALLPLVQRSYEYQALNGSATRLFQTAQVGIRMQISLGAEF
jgi:hypothetical protein